MTTYELYSVVYPSDREVLVYIKLPTWEYGFDGIGPLFESLTGVRMAKGPSSQGYKLLYHGYRDTLPENWHQLADVIVCGEEPILEEDIDKIAERGRD